MSLINYYGTTDPSEGRGVLDGTATKDGIEYSVWRDADGWTLGACHEDVGLMRYWSGDTLVHLLIFAGITREYVRETI